jgi:hypothetical protein
VPRLGWILLTVAVAVPVVGLIGAALFLVGDTSSESGTTPSFAQPKRLELPLADDPRALTLAHHAGPVLIGLAARPGARIEIAAVDGEDPIARSSLSVEVDGQPVGLEPCGHACTRAAAAVLDGRRHRVTVAVRGRASLRFELPPRLPPSGTAFFRRVERTMASLRTYRYRERLTSGVGRGVTATFDAQAPDRLRFRTGTGFRSVIVGRSRWDNRAGRWERTPFSGLRTSSFMWDGARNARVLGEAKSAGRRVQVLSVFDLDPVPAWFRLLVAPGGRVLEAEMLAPSHFMDHRYSGFNRPLSIEPPV